MSTDKVDLQELQEMAKQCLEEAGGDETKAQALLEERLRDNPRARMAAIEYVANKQLLAETFTQRRLAALDEIRARLTEGKTVRECLTEEQVAEIFRRHGFTSAADLQIQEYEAFPPERRQ